MGVIDAVSGHGCEHDAMAKFNITNSERLE
jgi:hypothetical protein